MSEVGSTESVPGAFVATLVVITMLESGDAILAGVVVYFLSSGVTKGVAKEVRMHTVECV